MTGAVPSCEHFYWCPNQLEEMFHKPVKFVQYCHSVATTTCKDFFFFFAVLRLDLCSFLGITVPC